MCCTAVELTVDNNQRWKRLRLRR